MSELPKAAREEVQRILNEEARRLLADSLDRDALGASSGEEGHDDDN